MLTDITLGQYFPGNSLLHRLDPRMKLILTLFYIIIVFLAQSVSAFILMILFTGLLIACSGIPLRIILRGMKPLLFLLIFTAVMNLFWTKGDTLLVSFWVIHIYLEGIVYAALMVMRILALLVGTGVLLTYTTSPSALTEGLGLLLSPLEKLHLNVHEFAMMMSIALRFIPTLLEETDKIMSAQKARGADFTTGNIIQRAKALIPVLIPLILSAFRRADDLAVAMECRCYHGGEGRSRMNVPVFHAKDWLMLLLFVVFCAAVLLVNRFIPIYSI